MHAAKRERALAVFFQLGLYTLVGLFLAEHVLFYQAAAAAAFH